MPVSYGGGALGLAPADDKIIQVERLLNLDPEAQLIASILSKKIAADSTHVLIDIPCGKSAKFMKEEGKQLGKKFTTLAKKFKIKLEAITTRGDEPIGNGIGPVLEIGDVLSILKQEKNKPLDLENKSLFLSARLLELTGKARKGQGIKIATNLLRSGAALKKFKQIIGAQHGSLENIDKKLQHARYKKHITAGKQGKIMEINNKKINAVARASGCPADKATGLYLWHHCNEKISKQDNLVTLYAESKARLKHAEKLFHRLEPVKIK